MRTGPSAQPICRTERASQLTPRGLPTPTPPREATFIARPGSVGETLVAQLLVR